MGAHQEYTAAWSWIYDFQPLIAGTLSIFAAVIGAWALWRASQAPIRAARAVQAAEIDRRRRYLGSVLSQELVILRHRCRQIEGAIKVLNASNHNVTDEGRPRLYLPDHPITDEWEFMSHLPGQLLSEIMKLRRHVRDHNHAMASVGSFSEDNWRKAFVDRLTSIAKAANALAGQATLLANGRAMIPAAPIELD
jgi:hypothetical protein